jgi:transcriptional regulator with XRE-family HTH domain
MKRFSDNLKRALKLRGMSQQDLAQRSGLMPAAINHFVCSRRLPSLDNFIKLAEALNVSADYLLGRTDQPQMSDKPESNDDLAAAASRLSPSQMKTLIKIALTLSAEAS